MFKDFGKELGNDLTRASILVKKSATELGGKLEKVGNVEKAAQTIKEGLIITSGIVMGGIILNTIIKKI